MAVVVLMALRHPQSAAQSDRLPRSYLPPKNMVVCDATTGQVYENIAYIVKPFQVDQYKGAGAVERGRVIESKLIPFEINKIHSNVGMFMREKRLSPAERGRADDAHIRHYGHRPQEFTDPYHFYAKDQDPTRSFVDLISHALPPDGYDLP